ncbi:MAG: flagellar type III secretion system pore protein FliP [Alphaproteobacteria bacterium]|nr:flagellar type III secretion system pore protein FliP [Alphaproteobacteria bacterium]
MRCIAVIAGIALVAFIAAADPALAEQVNIDLGQGTALTDRLIQIVALITVLSVAPSILIMVTSFVRIVVVLSLLRTAIGIQQSPPNSVLVSLALFLTAFIMAPTFEKAYSDGIAPLMAEQIKPDEAFAKTTDPLKAFMVKQVREKDLTLFFGLAKVTPPATAAETPLRILIPAFLISELRRAFEIGFLLFIPFLIIDMVVASLLMAMGMMMLPPVTISLPFKLIFFVLVDGWALVAGSLVQSYGVT